MGLRMVAVTWFSTNWQRIEARWVFLASFIAMGEREWSKMLHAWEPGVSEAKW